MGRKKKERKLAALKNEKKADCQNCSMTDDEIRDCGGYKHCCQNREEDCTDSFSPEVVARKAQEKHDELLFRPDKTSDTASKEVVSERESFVRDTSSESESAREREKEEEERAAVQILRSADNGISCSGINAPDNEDVLAARVSELAAELESVRRKLQLSAIGNKSRDEIFFEMMEDEDFLESTILLNRKVREKIIEGYLRALEGNSSVAKVITGNCGRTAAPPRLRPRSLAEAKALVDVIINSPQR